MTEQTPNLNGMLSTDELKQLAELLGNNSMLLGKGGNKNKKISSVQTRNNLLNQMTTQQVVPFKPVNEMNDEERQTYRDELKKRLRNKQTLKKQLRSNQSLLQKSFDSKIKQSTENMKKEDILDVVQNTPNYEPSTENLQETYNLPDNLEDFLN
jgi:hypothetical protein